jgi:hypothetical protein
MKLCTCFIGLLLSLCAWSQDQASGQPASSRARLISAYQSLAGHESRLYNGVRRTTYDPKMVGTAFFPSDSVLSGSVTYDGMRFDNVAMKFDRFRQELQILHFDNYTFSLLAERTTDFTVGGHHFVRHDANPAGKNPVPPGFYDHLYEGRSAILAHRSVFIAKKIQEEVIPMFIPQTDFYVQRNDAFVLCNNKRVAFRLFGKSAKLVKRHLQSKKIGFKKNFENALVESFRFLDSQH